MSSDDEYPVPTFATPPDRELPPGDALFSPPAATASHKADATRRRSDFWALMGCNAIVFGASVCVMVLELTASRLIAVHQGNSLYTWTSVIGVVLAGITIGNFFGGWLADRYSPHKVLGWLFLASGLSTFSVLWLNQWAAVSQRPSSMLWQAWVIFVVAWIFLTPALALGTISPVTASIALARSRKTGMTVGNVYAFGAMGSIFGTFLTGFYLVDVFGTKMIIVCTALALLAMGALVAAGQWAFRALVLFGAMQFVTVVGLCATADEDRLAAWSGKFGGWAWGAKEDDLETRVDAWTEWGRQLGRTLRDLGEILALRSDQPGDYNDESNYFAINISRDVQDGESVKELKLDHLLHSYYNADHPTKLYYDYERVYAAITERAANTWQRKAEVSLPAPPSDDISRTLPAAFQFDPARKRLSLKGAMSMEQFRELLSIGPEAEYCQALLQTWERSNSDSITFFATPLENLPEGVVFPKPLSEHVYWDGSLRSIICNQPLAFNDAMRLMTLGRHGDYVRAVLDLYHSSRQVSTLFIGGGGFVFPRWIEAKFPYQPLIDVAEIDPAVKLAVQRELGLPEDDKTAVRTHIGDARIFVDERRAQNAALLAEKKPPVLYDFIYGDAFNDFSVPWHLTTREFSEKVRELLTPVEGVYLVNIIDIYPRAEYPPSDRKAGAGQTIYNGPLPEGLVDGDLVADEKRPARPPFERLIVEARVPGKKYVLSYQGVMPDEIKKQLHALARRPAVKSKPVDPASKADGVKLAVDLADVAVTGFFSAAFREAVRDLHTRSNARQVYEGTLPTALRTVDMEAAEWTSIPGFEHLEIRKQDAGHLLGFRGVMSGELRDRLLQAAGQDTALRAATESLYQQSRAQQAGQFLGRYVNTVRQVFPCIYLFSGNEDAPSDDRDTFVVACALRPLNMDDLAQADGHWSGQPFAAIERIGTEEKIHGQMRAVLESARGLTLTDDFAPVDNLLAPVFVRQ